MSFFWNNRVDLQLYSQAQPSYQISWVIAEPNRYHTNPYQTKSEFANLLFCQAKLIMRKEIHWRVFCCCLFWAFLPPYFPPAKTGKFLPSSQWEDRIRESKGSEPYSPRKLNGGGILGPKNSTAKNSVFLHLPSLRSHVIWMLYCYRPETWRQCKTRHGPKTGFGENGNIENLVWLSFSSGLVWYFSLKNWFGNDLCIAYASRFLDNYEINLFRKALAKAYYTFSIRPKR